jgi:hypothetical protein
MRGLPIPALLLCLLWFPGMAQQLHVRSTKAIADLGHFVALPVRCDAGQNVFVRTADAPGTKIPILEFDAEGKELRRFDTSQTKPEGIERALVRAYTVAPDGSLYELLGVPNGNVAVIRFKPTGEYAGAVFLDKSFNPAHLAVFRTGELFVDGTTTAGKDAQEPFMAIFDPMGRFLTEVKSDEPRVALSPPIAPKHPAKEGKSEAQGTEILPNSVTAFDLGLAESGSDLVYLLRQGKKPTILAVSAAGTVDHELVLTPPAAHSEVVALNAGPGELLVQYVQPQAASNGNDVSTLVLYDSSDGTKLSEYELDTGMLGAFACTDWRGSFTFLSRNNDDQPVMLTATAR